MAIQNSSTPSVQTTSSPISKQAEKRLIKERLDEYVMERVRFRAKTLADKFCMDTARREDIEQDMIVELIKTVHRYDASKASWHTYACRVLDLAVKKLTHRICSQIERESGKPVNLTYSPDGSPLVTNNLVHEGTGDLGLAEMRMDIAVVFERLPKRLRQMCELLKTETPTDAAKVMGINRSSIYPMIAKARRYFEIAGLDFSKNSAAN